METDKHRSITISVDQVDRNLEISVLDSGKGVPDSMVDHLFTPFYTTKEVGKTSGLALSVARRVID